MAADALEMLVKLIRGERVEPRTRLYTPTLDIRASCGAPKEVKP
jgi:DNA-binding LacI/PurR family transcriptional regulator